MQNFIKTLSKEFKEIYPNADVTIKKFTKCNDVKKVGLMIHEKNNNTSPVIYLEPFFQEYKSGKKSISDVNFEIRKIYENNKSYQCTVDFFDFKTLKSHIKMKILNTEKCENFTSDLPKINFFDLSVIFYVELNINEGLGNVNITNSLLSRWEKTIDDLVYFSLENMRQDYIFDSLLNQIMNLIDDEIDFNEPCMMYILTNKEKQFGASCMVVDSILRDIGEKLRCDYYIVPSSIHELIIIPKKNASDVEFIKSTIQEVNNTQVAEDEILSYNLYEYSRELGKINLV